MSVEQQEAFRARLEAHGVPPSAGVLVGPPNPDAPRPPEGPWVVVPHGGEYVVGGVGRGSFAAYTVAPDLDAAAAIVQRLVTTAPRSIPESEVDAIEQRAAVTAAGIRERTRQRDRQPGTAMVGPGEALDTFGVETSHHLYALETPFAERSQPPSDVEAPYHRYLVLTVLPEASEGIAAPWFGQPGGGAMVVLTKPIRWYVDQGHLVEITG